MPGVGLTPSGPVTAEDVRDLKRGPCHGPRRLKPWAGPSSSRQVSRSKGLITLRIVLVATRYLEPILEPVFHTNHIGYRPGKSAHDALAVARRRCWSHGWVLDLDINSFFDEIDWSQMALSVNRNLHVIAKDAGPLGPPL